MENLLPFIGIILSVLLIKKYKLLAIGLMLFWITELLFRDFGLLSFPFISTILSKILFFIASVFLSISVIVIAKQQGGNDK